MNEDGDRVLGGAGGEDEDSGRMGDRSGDGGSRGEPDGDGSMEPQDDVESDAPSSDRRPSTDRFRDALGSIRTRPRHHFVAMVITAFVGLFLAWIHWIGLIIAGALVGIVSPSLRNGVFSALGFGFLVITLFMLSHGTGATRVLRMEPIIYITLLSALVLPVLGSLVRGLESES